MFQPSSRQLRVLTAIQDINETKSGYCTVYDILTEFEEEITENRRTAVVHCIAPMIAEGIIEPKVIHTGKRGHPLRGYVLTTKAADFV